VDLSPSIGFKVARIWHDTAVQRVYDNRSDMQLQSNAAHLLNSVERISAVDYVPTQADILSSRVRTTGVVEVQFVLDGFNFRVVDVGGQRCERRKWLHFFENVTALLYVIALDEYDMTLFEDHTTNRMQESLLLFEEMVNSRFFEKTSLILFLNKKDLFREKIKKVGLDKYFPDYRGGADYKQATAWMKNTYVSLNHTKKSIYCHFTCATNTDNIHKVFEDVRHNAIMQTLSQAGVL